MLTVRADQTIILPPGAVVCRMGQTEELTIANRNVPATNLHPEECYAIGQNQVRAKNGWYAKLLAAAEIEGGLSIARGETVFVQPYSAVYLGTVGNKLTQGTVTPATIPDEYNYDPFIGFGLMLLSAAYVKFGIHNPIIGMPRR